MRSAFSLGRRTKRATNNLQHQSGTFEALHMMDMASRGISQSCRYAIYIKAKNHFPAADSKTRMVTQADLRSAMSQLLLMGLSNKATGSVTIDQYPGVLRPRL